MSGSIFGTDALSENGWATEEDNMRNSAYQYESTYPTSSQLQSALQYEDDDEQINTFQFNESKIPQSFKVIYEKLKDQLNTGNDFELLILDKMVENQNLSSYQRSKIMNTLFDQNLVHFSHSSNFYQSLGLVALENEVSGTGDYVTLQFRIGDLPEIPQNVVKYLTQVEEGNTPFVDPLTSQLAETSLEDDWNSNVNTLKSTYIEEIPQVIPKAEDKQPAADSEISKYINSIRDEFKVLFDSSEIVHIKEVPEKEGLIFKHINYVITHQISLGNNAPAGPKRVNRRYSDFVWYVKFKCFIKSYY